MRRKLKTSLTMKRALYFFAFIFSFLQINAQTISKEFESSILGENRQLKIQIPRDYDNTDKRYPIIVVLDGDYLFEIVASNVDYHSYWQDIPEAIVVGVNQVNSREDDIYYSEQNSLPIKSGANFFEFIGMELIPYIEKVYRTEKFKVIIGHGLTANFINYFLLKEAPLFKAYISLSPDLAEDMPTYLSERLSDIDTKIFYYTATSNNDIKKIKTKTEALNVSLSAIDNKNLLKSFDSFDGPSHYSLPAHAIPKAFEKIFFVFRPISKKEFKETILKLDSSPVDYLLEKYAAIEDLFGKKKQISINDFKAIAAAIKKTEKYEYYEQLGKLARNQYPETLLGHYYLGRFYENTGKPKKAMKTYQSAYTLDDIGGITKDQVLQLSDDIKADFGY